MMLILGSHKMSRSPPLTTRILKVYIEALMGFSHMYYPDGCSNTLVSQGSVLGAASSAGKASRKHILRTGKRVRSL